MLGPQTSFLKSDAARWAGRVPIGCCVTTPAAHVGIRFHFCGHRSKYFIHPLDERILSPSGGSQFC